MTRKLMMILFKRIKVVEIHLLRFFFSFCFEKDVVVNMDVFTYTYPLRAIIPSFSSFFLIANWNIGSCKAFYSN